MCQAGSMHMQQDNIQKAENRCWPCRHPFQIKLVIPRLGIPKRRAGVAQLVERKALNLVVKGSSPFFGDVRFLFSVLPTRSAFADASHNRRRLSLS